MKILFVASIQGKDAHVSDYQAIVNALEKTGGDVTSDHVMKYSQADLDAWTNEEKVDFHKKLIDYIKKTDIVVSEVSFPSVSVGYLISVALDFGKPTILLYKGSSEPNLLSTLATSDKLQVVKYDDTSKLGNDMQMYIDYASGQSDTRFNFFVSPSIVSYLDWVSKKRRIPRAVYLRRLIEEDMRANKEYSEGEDA